MKSSPVDSPIFGPILSGVEYIPRPAAYALIFKSDRRIAVCKARRGYFLPGGGADPRESPEETVLREVKEETSRDARILHRIGEAIEYFSVDNRYYRLEAVFFWQNLLATHKAKANILYSGLH